MESINLTNTLAGLAAIQRAMAGEDILFTKLEIGDGVLTNTDVSGMTGLINKTKEYVLGAVKAEDSEIVRLRSNISNAGVTQDLIIREYGIYAKFGNEQEFLFAYLNVGDLTTPLPNERIGRYELNRDFVLYIGNSTHVDFTSNGNLVYITVNEYKDDIDKFNNQKLNKKNLNMTMIPKPYKHNGDLNSDVKSFVKVDENTFDIITKNQDLYLSLRYRYNDFASGASDAGSYKPNAELFRLVSTEDIKKCALIINNPTSGNYDLFKDNPDGYFPFLVTEKGRKYNTENAPNEGHGIRVYKVTAPNSIQFNVKSYGSKVNKKTNILFFRSASSSSEVDILVNGSVVKTVNLKKESSGAQYMLVELDSLVTTEQFQTFIETSIEIVPKSLFCYVVGVNYTSLEDSDMYTQGFDTMLCDVSSTETQLVAGANDYAFKYAKNNKWIGSYHGGETKTAEPSISIKGKTIPSYNDTIARASLGFKLGHNITILQRTQLWNETNIPIAQIHSETKFNINGTVDFDFTFKSLEEDGFLAGENFYYNMTCARDTYNSVNMTTGDFFNIPESPTLNLSYGFVEQAISSAVSARAICSRFDLPKFRDDSEYKSWIWKRDSTYNKLYVGFKNIAIENISIKTSKDFYTK